MIGIREARVEDVPLLVEFNRSLAKESENLDLHEETLKRGLTALFEDPAKGRYYVAEEETEDGSALEVVGCHSITFEWSDWRNGVVWWLQSVYVKPSHRKRGVFRLMFNNLMEIIRDDPSIMGLRLYADASNLVAHKTYEAMGMNGEHYKTFERMKGGLTGV